MGYTTDFYGNVSVTPPLNAEEIAYLRKFNQTRRMDRSAGPYFVNGSGDFGQGNDADILDHNRPPKGQPGLWCNWTPTDDGGAIEWDGGEKFYNSPEWMEYLIEHFLKPDCLAKSQLPFLQGHVLNGEIEAQGEDHADTWKLKVTANTVETLTGRLVYD